MDHSGQIICIIYYTGKNNFAMETFHVLIIHICDIKEMGLFRIMLYAVSEINTFSI